MEASFRLSATQEVLGVSTITTLVKEQIESNFAGVWVRGEVSNLTRSSAGHHYFNLREKDALLKAVLFKSRGRFFSRHLREGTEVICYGDVTVYEPRGEYQLVVDFVEPAGLGALFAQLEHLKQRLQEEGLFDQSRKRALPPTPRRIALLASHTGAALQDMLRILQDYPLPVDLLIYHIASQGDEAPPSICRAFDALRCHCRAELVVLARGGGSVEDLWAFNHESVVRAVAYSPVPVITGIGHEIDTTLADLAADLRAPTPTAAAEVILSNAFEQVQRFEELKTRMREALSQKVSEQRARLEILRTRLEGLDPKRRLTEQRLHLTRLSDCIMQSMERGFTSRRVALTGLIHRLEKGSPLLQVERRRDAVKALGFSLNRLALTRLQSHRHRLGLLSERLKGLSPMAPLERGYALCTKEDRLVRSARELEVNDQVKLRFLTDAASCRVESVFRLPLSEEGSP